MLSADQLERAHDAIRETAQEIAVEADDPEAFEHALQACDRLRMASRVPEWSREHWLGQALESALAASSIDARWERLSARIQTLLACQMGLAVA
jgi:hypothetical protein